MAYAPLQDQLGSAACPVVVRPHKHANNFELQDENLLRLLTDSDVADLPVVVLSVAGGFRLGKSFLLGFCIRYLKQLEMSSDRSDWMGEENIPLTGFSWKYGSERETTGIQLWGKVFKIKTRQHGLVAVVLMDTEGSFDNRSTMEGNVTVFSMSVLLSSVQVYNLTKQITQSDLEHLKLFTEYASMARSAGGRDKEVFQKLLFLIRDWQYPGEKSFGLEGGEALLQPFLQRDPTLQNEVSELRENIRNSFSEVKCFLMPRPGDAVENTKFDGKLRDISGDFKYHLKNLVSCLLSPERLIPKKINGRIVTCKELVSMFESVTLRKTKFSETVLVEKNTTQSAGTNASTNFCNN
ncbi:atlastin-2-like [Ornithodoros turicata]|uniref:atlastin-2-like n=1 Tax=Ornithodoros turicata TaxID=34597 RepID=UPI0031394A34